MIPRFRSNRKHLRKSRIIRGGMMKICKAKINDGWQEVPFHGVFQYSDVIAPSPLVGGHKGGTIAYPVAVVELDNQLIVRNIDSVKDIEEVEE